MTTSREGLGNAAEELASESLASIRRLTSLLADHVAYRNGCLNLVAAENVMSPRARSLLCSELVGRYADYVGRDLRTRKYMGTRYIVAIEEEVNALLRALFRARYVEPRPLAGHLAGAAAVLAFTRPGDIVFELDSPSGGHRMAEKLNAVHHARLGIRALPFDPVSYTVDAARTLQLAQEVCPRMIILGSSLFLFPHPVAELAEGLRGLPDTLLAYDASHVLGLMAGGMFQDPLREGASIVWSSTHKTFPGPPGGLIMTQSERLIKRVSEAIYPGLVTNHSPERMPALGVAAAEMLVHGRAYATATVAYAQRLGAELTALGLPVAGSDRGYTRSHTILLRVGAFGNAAEVSRRLEEGGIISTPCRLPPQLGTQGVRIGLQEITRRGASADDMIVIASLIADVILGRRGLPAIRSDTRDVAAMFSTVRYTLDDP